MSLKTKAVHGIAWVGLSAVIIRALNFLTKIVLAILLVPDDFGLIAIGLLAINTMGLFRDFGFGASIIYMKDVSKDRIVTNTAFIILPIVSTVLFILTYLFAPYIASFYNTTLIEPIIRVLALTFIISSFGTVPSMLLEKELKFKKKVLPETVPIIGYACVTVVFAINGYGVWSLVYGQIMSAVLNVIILWIVSDWRPNFHFDRNVAKDMFGYGKNILAASVVIFFITNIDNAIIGRILGMEALGFYAIAYTISNLPATQITHLVGRVMFPTYSKLQDNKEALGRAYLKTFKMVSMLSIPATLGILIIAPDFIEIVLKEKWMPAVPALQVLCIFGLFRSIAATTGSIFQATGRPDILFKTSLLQLVITVILIYLLIDPYGIVGVSLAVTIPVIIQSILQIYIVSKIIYIDVWKLCRSLYPICLSSLIMSICIYLVLYNIADLLQIQSVIALIFSVFSGVIIYFGGLYIFDKDLMKSIRSLVVSIGK